MPTCIGSVLKGLLACINFLVLACGLAVVGLGASALAGVLPLVKDWSVWIVAALMVVGGLSAILAALCLFGIWFRSKWAIWTYAIIVIILIGCELAIAIIAIKFRWLFDAAGSLIWSVLGDAIQQLIGTTLVCNDYTTCTTAAIALFSQQLTIVYAVLFSLLGCEVIAVIAACVTISEMRRGKSLYYLYQGPGGNVVVPVSASGNPPSPRSPHNMVAAAPPMQPMPQEPTLPPQAATTDRQNSRVVIEETRRYVM